MKWNQIILEDLNESEKVTVNRLRKEYQKLLKGHSSDLGRWLVQNENGIKAYMPEIYTNAFYALVSIDQPINTVRKFNEVGNYYKNLIRR